MNIFNKLTLFVYFTGLSLVLLPLVLHAQGKVITGVVYDSQNRPLRESTVSAYNSKSIKPVQIISTKANGSFSFSKNNLSYIYISHVGYIPYKVIISKQDTFIIHLMEQIEVLKGINIQSQLPFIEQQFDRMIVNVGGGSKVGINAVDVLQKIPGVTFINNDLKLEGKTVSVYVDGKPTRLSGRELFSLLNNTTTSNLNQIEVIYNPSSKFEAEGEGGIINLKSIKRVKPGYDANISVTGGHGWKYFYNNNINGGINYRTGNNFFYGNYGFGQGTQYQEINTATNLISSNQRLNDFATYKTPNYDNNIRLGWDHFLNKNDVVGILVTGFYNSSNPMILANTNIFNNKNASLDSVKSSDSKNLRNSKGITFNFNYKFLIDSLMKKEIIMDGDFDFFYNGNDNNISSTLQNDLGQPISPVQLIQQQAITHNWIYSYKADYSQKLYKGVFESGVKASYVKIDNDFISLNGISGNNLKDNGSNNFIYNEKIIAGYINTRQTWNKITLQIGIRGEQTFTTGNSINLGNIIERKYLNFFPNLTAGYQLKNGLLSFSYSNRIGRPSYNYLNPFIIYRSAYASYQGNPYLLPSYTNNYRLSYSMKNGLGFSANYSAINNVISDLSIVNDTSKITTTIKSNLTKNYGSNFAITFNKELAKWININYGSTISYNIYKFTYDRSPIDIKQFTGSAYADNQFNFAKNYWIDMYIYARTKATYGSQINLPLATSSISGGKKIFSGKGNISLRINDPFFWGVERFKANYGNVDIYTRSQYDSRNFRLNLTYKFGNSNVNVRSRNAGSTDEQRRTQ